MQEKRKNGTGLAELKERVQTEILAAQTENKGEYITKEQLKQILETYFKDVPKEITVDLELIAKEEYGGYKVKIADIYKGKIVENIGNVEQLAEDALIINLEAEEATMKSPYVMYNGMLCRVLYDKTSEYGLQIVTAESVETVSLGSTDEMISIEDFSYTGSSTVDDGAKKAVVSYNKVVDTLNNKAKTYMDTKGIAKNARCLGSSPNYEEDSTAMDSITKYDYLITYGWDKNVFKVEDERYTQDAKQIKTLGLASGYVWMASRKISYSGSSSAISVRCIRPDDYVEHSQLFKVYSDGRAIGYESKNGFRPVFSLEENVKVIDGKGTKEDPYILN